MAGPVPQSVTEPIGAIEAALERALEPIGHDRLRAAMAHAVLGGGKRIRPLLCWHACVAAGGTGDAALPACVAVELVHAFSLVHDDLPAMDDDDLRRGKPTVHIAYNEATAILAGDALLALASSVLAGATDGQRLAGDLSRATLDMIEGQMLDTAGLAGVAGGAATPDLESVRRIHSLKTGALISFATAAGARSAGAADDVVAGFGELGATIGMLFQVVDDLLDEEQSTSDAGKRTGKDREAGKLTFPVAIGLEATRAEADRLAERAHRQLEELGIGSGPLADLAAWLGVRRH